MDITTGETFTSGETNIDHTKLNNIANLAVINATFVTGKSAVADNVDPATYLMLFVDPASSGTFYKGTLNKLFTHTSLINGGAALTTLAGTEVFHIYDGANKKITASNLYTAAAASAALVASQTANTDPKLGDSVLLYDLSTTSNKKLTMGSLINDAAAVTTVAATDVLAIGNGTTGGAGSYNSITAYNLMGGAAALTSGTVAVNDELSIRDVSATSPKRITIDSLFQIPAANTVTSLSATNLLNGVVSGAGTSLAITPGNLAQTISPPISQTVVNTASTQVLSAAVWADVTGMTVTTGTPFSTASRFLITVSLSCTATAVTYFRLQRNAATIAVADPTDAGSRVQATFGVVPAVTDTPNILSFTYLDAPVSASAVTYTLQAFSVPGGSLRVNRTGTDTNNTNFVRMVSTLTTMERPQ